VPERIQRKRAKGWKMPENTVYVGRPSLWGNPYSADHHYRSHHPDVPIIHYSEAAQTAAEAVEKFRSYVNKLDLAPLRGKNLACWCRLGEPCHADVLLELANPKVAV
jgi:hypothetical protein